MCRKMSLLRMLNDARKKATSKATTTRARSYRRVERTISSGVIGSGRRGGNGMRAGSGETVGGVAWMPLAAACGPDEEGSLASAILRVLKKEIHDQLKKKIADLQR